MELNKRYDAIYARQSVDRADSISIESQIDICLRETKTGEYHVYQDRGYSGKNTERPGWQALLADVRAGKIRRVITYRLDRISRSVLDFANIIEIFRQYNVSFSSTTEKFDTSHPIGNAMLMIVMVFAQLERETIQQRVIDAYRDRSEKGFYMGGPVPYGYRLIQGDIGGKKTKMYQILPDEAAVIRLVYDMYAKPQTSFGDVVRELNRLGIRNRRGEAIGRSRIRDFVCNPVYLRADLAAYEFFVQQGVQIYNDAGDFIGTNGCYLYSGDSGKRKTLSLAGHKLVLAPHEGIVESSVWLACRKKCLSNRSAARPIKAKNTWLAGKLKCARCGYALTVKAAPRAHGEPYRYFVCRHKYDSGGCKGIGVLYREEVHHAILEEVRRKLAGFPILRGGNHASAADTERMKLQIEIAQITGKIDTLIESLLSLNGAAIDAVNSRINRLSMERDALQMRAAELEDQRDAANTQAITGYMELWDLLSFDDKKAVIDAVIQVIYADSEHLVIHWKI